MMEFIKAGWRLRHSTGKYHYFSKYRQTLCNSFRDPDIEELVANNRIVPITENDTHLCCQRCLKSVGSYGVLE